MSTSRRNVTPSCRPLNARQSNSGRAQRPRSRIPDARQRPLMLPYERARRGEVEVSLNTFRSADREIELNKVLTMARRHAKQGEREVYYRVHRAYRPYLELVWVAVLDSTTRMRSTPVAGFVI